MRKCKMSTLFSGHYLHNRSTLDIGVLGYIGIVQHKEHSPEVLSVPPGTPCIYHRNMVCFRYVTVNTLHKDDKNDDNNNNHNESSTEQNLSLWFADHQQRRDTCQGPLTILIYKYYGHHTKWWANGNHREIHTQKNFNPYAVVCWLSINNSK